MATIVYDAEVFPHNWMFGFKIIETQEYIQIWDDFKEIKEFIKEHKENNFFIGFNSKFYDDIIMDTVLAGKNPYEISQKLIHDREKIYARNSLIKMDIMEGMMPGISLKAIESELGMSIEESHIDFNIDRPLTPNEIEDINRYNKHDLDATEKLLGHRWSNFVKTKLDLINYFNLPSNAIQHTLATMVAKGLGAKKGDFPPRHFQWYPELQIKNEEVKKFIINEEFLKDKFVFDLNGVEHVIGLGGIHGAKENFKSEKFWKIDVKGYYSLIQMEKNLLSRSLPTSGEQKYKDLYFDRLERKKRKDPSADSLKGGILAVWGATLNQYQLLSDISTGNLIMITGQAFMIDLVEKLEPYSTLIQTNTDGIFIEPFEGQEDTCRAVIQKWVDRTGFEVEFEEGTKLYQKDVNNYTCLLNGNSIKNVEAKGAYVNMWNMQDDLKFFEYKLTHNLSQGTVVDKALVYYFLFDKPVEETINSEMNPKSFQYTIKKGASTYSHVELHETPGDTTEVTIVSNVNRVFASKDPNINRRIYKIKNGKTNIFPRLDINVFLFNDDLAGWSDKEWEMLDRNYYIDQAYQKIEDFISIRDTKVSSKKPKVTIKVFPRQGTKIKDNQPELSEASIYEMITTMNNGVLKIGDLVVNRNNDIFTFEERDGKVSILNFEKLELETFKIKVGNLKKEKIKIDNNHYFDIIEKTLNTEVIYTDKTNEDESFNFLATTFEEALQQLDDYKLI
jgi:hypothetical protein